MSQHVSLRKLMMPRMVGRLSGDQSWGKILANADNQCVTANPDASVERDDGPRRRMTNESEDTVLLFE